MNQNLIEINKNTGATIDEKGKITTIIKSSDEYEFEEILRRENELEDLNAKCSKAKADYDYNKFKNAWATIFNVITYLMTGVSVALFLIAKIPPISIVIGSGGIYGLGKMMTLGFGTKKRRKAEKEKLTQEISKLEEDISKLEEELEDIKDKVKYKEESCTEEDVDYETFFEVSPHFKDKVKVKRLGTHN